MAFSDLRTDVESWMARADFPLSIYDLATARINRVLRVRQMLTAYSDTAAQVLTLPSDFLGFDILKGVTAGREFPINPVSPFTAAHGDSPSGVPTEYSIANGATSLTMRLNPAPDSAYVLSGMYFGKLANFTTDSDTNSVLTDFPDIYLSAVLMHTFAYSRNAEQAALHGANFTNQVMEANDEYQRNRYSSPLRSVADAVA